MSAGGEDTDDRTCGVHFVEASDDEDDDPRPSAEDIERMGGKGALLMREYNKTPLSPAGFILDSVTASCQCDERHDFAHRVERRPTQHLAVHPSPFVAPIERLSLQGPCPLDGMDTRATRLYVHAQAIDRVWERQEKVSMGCWLGSDRMHAFSGYNYAPKTLMVLNCATPWKKISSLVIGDLFYADNPENIRKEAVYMYDLGDCFMHSIRLEDVQAFDDGNNSDKKSVGQWTQLINGARAAPPEDCGGNWQYANAMNEGNLGMDPDHFDLNSAQERIRLGFLSIKKQRKKASAQVKSNWSHFASDDKKAATRTMRDRAQCTFLKVWAFKPSAVAMLPRSDRRET